MVNLNLRVSKTIIQMFQVLYRNLSMATTQMKNNSKLLSKEFKISTVDTLRKQKTELRHFLRQVKSPGSKLITSRFQLTHARTTRCFTRHIMVRKWHEK
jgi:hypothetical protein